MVTVDFKHGMAGLFVWLSVFVLFWHINGWVDLVSFVVFIFAMDQQMKYHKKIVDFFQMTFGSNFWLYVEVREKVKEMWKVMDENDVGALKMKLNELESILKGGDSNVEIKVINE